MSSDWYSEIKYTKPLSENAKKDLKILAFDSFLKNSKKILDIGCSLGRVISIDPKRIHGVDIDKKAINLARKKGYDVRFGDVTEKLPFKDSSFDAIFCSQVIEHLDDPVNSLREMRRVLKENGRVFIVTPDYIMTSRKYDKGFWGDYTHKRPMIPETLQRLAYDSGFKKFRVYHFPGKGFRNLIRAGILSKESWIKLEKLPLVWKNQDLILEAIKT